MNYRHEIDGLRAFAVLTVIFFHAKFEIFKGGFLGVDIFFVISGYLISSILLLNIKNNNFSFIRFYYKRVKRLFPALFVVMIITSIPSYFLMLPDELENFGQSIISTLGFSNNLLLFITTDYWQLEADFKPLLHTWSLGVEEQFYLFFPTFIYLFTKKNNLKRTEKYLWILLLSSFSSIFIFENAYGIETFYLMPTRLWEFAFGALVAVRRLQNTSNLNYPFLGILGLIIISVCVIMFDKTTPLPFLIMPVIGTSLIIMYTNPGEKIYKMLTISPLKKIGLLSYGAYLIHVPLFTYFRLGSNSEPSKFVYIILIILSFLLADLMYKYIEEPFRNGKFSQKALKSFLIISITYLIIFSSVIVYSEGFSSKFYGKDSYGQKSVWTSYCNRIYEFKSFNKTSKGIKILVFGSSYARDIANSLLEAGSDNQIQICYINKYYDCDFVDISRIDAKTRILIDESEVVIFGGGGIDTECINTAIEHLENIGKKVLYTGYKNF